ncbi:MAG: NAD(P)-dependent oxidoreductase [Bernardetiaceae bacterium]
MKKIALFGASGRTGQQFLEQALAAGYQVQALVRTPGKVQTSHKNLSIVKGDVLIYENVAETVTGTDVVVSLFGHVKGSPEWLQTNGTQHIVEAMQAHGIKKIISLSGGGLPYPDKDRPKIPDLLIRTLMKLFVPRILNDAIGHHEVLQKSGVDWIIVRGPRLTDAPKRGQYRVGWVGVDASTQIGRADLANFLLTQVEEDRFLGQMPFVSY